MIISIQYDTRTGEVLKAGNNWQGNPKVPGIVVYALFEATPTNLLKERWYVYGHKHDASPVEPEDLPELVRLAHMMIE